MKPFKKYFAFFTVFALLLVSLLHDASHAFAHEINSAHLHVHVSSVHAHEHDSDHDPAPLDDERHVNISELSRTVMKQRSCEHSSPHGVNVCTSQLTKPAFRKLFWLPLERHPTTELHFYSHLAHAPPA